MELGMGELLVILVVVLLLFGGSKLPAVGEGLGKAIRSFKDAAGGADAKPAAKPAAPEAEAPKPPSSANG